MNQPYIKKYNEFGEVVNPIKGSYISQYHNRERRRRKTGRFHNNRKEVDSRPVQWVKMQFGKFRKILHKLADLPHHGHTPLDTQRTE